MRHQSGHLGRLWQRNHPQRLAFPFDSQRLSTFQDLIEQMVRVKAWMWVCGWDVMEQERRFPAGGEHPGREPGEDSDAGLIYGHMAVLHEHVIQHRHRHAADE